MDRDFIEIFKQFFQTHACTHLKATTTTNNNTNVTTKIYMFVNNNIVFHFLYGKMYFEQKQ